MYLINKVAYNVESEGLWYHEVVEQNPPPPTQKEDKNNPAKNFPAAKRNKE